EARRTSSVQEITSPSNSVGLSLTRAVVARRRRTVRRNGWVAGIARGHADRVGGDKDEAQADAEAIGGVSRSGGMAHIIYVGLDDEAAADSCLVRQLDTGLGVRQRQGF